MSGNKKDLTRIEDLGEFIHELNADEESDPFESSTSEVPDLPSEALENTFAQDEEESFLDFGDSFTEETPESESESESESEPESSFLTSDEEASPWETSSLDEDAIDFSASTEEEKPLFEAEVEEPQTESTSGPLLSNDWDSPIEDPIETAAPIYTPPERPYKSPETFEDIKLFSESSSLTGMAQEGNPSFSLLIKNVRFIEDVNDIILLLKELGLLSDTEELTKGRLMRGMLLVPRISEYAAIFLAHKLRRFDIDIQLGLSDEIHPPKHQETPETGIVSKFSLYQNQTHHFHFDDPKLDISQIIVAATPSLEGYQILRYMGVASEHKMLDNHTVEDSESTEVPLHYQELAQKLKAHALKANSNAIIGLNYQLTPIGRKYRLTCTGNLVWVNKL